MPAAAVRVGAARAGAHRRARGDRVGVGRPVQRGDREPAHEVDDIHRHIEEVTTWPDA